MAFAETKEGVLERRGFMGKWAASTFVLHVRHLAVLDKKGKKVEEVQVTAAKKIQSQRGDENTFSVFFEDKKGKEDKWVLRAKSREQYSEWFDAIVKQLSAPDDSEPDYGLPSTDPRTGLPIIGIPKGFEETFRFLKIAVFHWFGPVKKLGTSVNGKFSVEERVLVLGDRCLYFCKPNADITRCILISNIKRLLLAQEDSRDLYVAILMPETITHTDKDNVTKETAEYDVMFHTPDIQTFVRYLRTVYQYQTNYNTLELDQVVSKDQLEKEVRLVKPEDWMLVYWPPMFKEVLAKLLDDFNANYQHSEQASNQGGAGAPQLPAPTKGASLPALDRAPPPNPMSPPNPRAAAMAIPAEAAKAASSPPAVKKPRPARRVAIDEVPLGKYLVMIGQSKYFDLMYAKSIDLEMLVGKLVDDNDLEFFGVDSAEHRRQILAGADDKDLIEDITSTMSPRVVAPSARALPPPVAHVDPAAAADLEVDFDDDFDLDLGDDGDAVGFGGGGGGGGFGEIDLEEFDFDLDVASPAGGNGGDDLDLDLDDLDLSTGPANNTLDLDLDDL
eukprot:TRINITY_DN4575_c0_g1_i1.p1 TRINITY_DN4575_c0_g1~~TRINITY_DN4575_c0_g1_i1.p1  ORF type:complete len:591 (+),score=219.06 TRINITY_DN4575_c0_g1_i1:98-1774(+)